MSALRKGAPWLAKGRAAFTLIELLITMTVIALLASLVLGAAYRATESAKVSNTESRIAKLHDKVMGKWDTYRTRRLPIDPRVVALNQGWSVANIDLARARLVCLRELMRLELPHRWEDVTGDVFTFPGPPVPTLYLTALPSLSRAYLTRYNSNQVNGVSAQPSELYQGAECLYLLVTMGLEDDSLGTEHANLDDVGDLDGDGMREFHDTWGNPISFLRWAPGFVSELQPLPRNPVEDHDPFDPMKLDLSIAAPFRGFRMQPLIYSSGPDQTSELWSVSAVMGPALNDPYDATGPQLPGSPYDTNGDGGDDSLDNLHNQLITVQ